MIKLERPQICFLQETKCTSDRLGSTLSKIWPGCRSMAVDATGASGGLAIAWNPQSITLTNFHATHHLMQATFHFLGTNIHGNLTNVYFPQDAGSKKILLDNIEELNRNRQHPLWIAAGDFNMITRMEEKIGGKSHMEPEVHHFKDFIVNASLIDMPFCNGTYTWSNRRGGTSEIASKLDRFLISDNAFHLGGDLTAEILAYSGSDHWPIALLWQRPGDKTKKPFRFEAFWLTHPTFKDFIKNTWASFIPPEGSKMYQLQQKLRFLKGNIKRWNRETFGNIFDAQKELHKELKDIHQEVINSGHTEATLDRERHITKQIDERRKQEEIYWRQKSRIQWLKEGERNTKFFHRTTVQRRMHNQIPFIVNHDWVKVEEHGQIEEVLLNHFQQVHREQEENRHRAIGKITSNIPKLVTAQHNEILMSPISAQEVDEAMGQLKEGKAPGPDGFTTTFFHALWDMIKGEVWQVVEESRAKRWLLPALNSTFITLIPKEENSITPEKFRPIALCNVLYKIISKVIANRLKPLLPMIISPKQSGYVEGRQIMDGIILTHEIIHSLKSSKQAGMLLKLDLSKAFDKLSWSYIENMLKAFGFCHSWIRWIMSLISSAHFSLLVNGLPSRPFKPSRGIRQGDPLSPFLFIIMAEGLGRHLKQALLSNQLKGISIHNSPASSHQQFVDDTMLYGYPSAQEASRLKSLLKDFSDASGLHVNNAKSQIFFFHTPPSVKLAITRILGFHAASLPSTYLGAPLTASAIKQPAWRVLLEKFESKLNLWTYRSLNMANRAVLIKSILQAMPLYLFSILAAPKWVLKRLRNLQRDFLWGSSASHRKWALVKWEMICKPKSKGGIGLRDPESSNIIMNAKIWWQWLTNPDKIWASIWTAKYTNNSPQNEIIRYEPMQPKLSNILPPRLIPNRQEQQLATVHQFWKQDLANGFRQWSPSNQIITNATKQEEITLEEELRKISIRMENSEDILRWGYSPKGTYTTSEAYTLSIHSDIRPDPLWDRIWSFKAWLKISHLLWMVGHRKILTWDKLRRRNFHGPSICHNCFNNEENQQHLLDTCPLASKLWDQVSFRCQLQGKKPGDIIDTIRQWPKSPYDSEILNHLWNIIPGIVIWNIWKERNRRIFKNQSSTTEEIWIRMHSNLKETMHLKSWTKEDLPTKDREQNILNNWKLELPQEIASQSAMKGNNKENRKWMAPPANTYKLNFDGASKGNPGPAGYGGIIRDHKGNTILIYFGNIGWDTNNSAELEGLWQGLLEAKCQNLHPLIIEGDSQIILGMVSRIHNGSQTRKVADSWRLEARLHNIAQELHNHRALSFHHSRREGNRVAYLLANIGVECHLPFQAGNLDIIPSSQQSQECKILLQDDIDSPDAGATGQREDEPLGYHVIAHASPHAA
eukprot:PITA_31502